MNLKELDYNLRKLNYVEENQKQNNANYNYMGLDFEESPIPKMPQWHFFESSSITIIKSNRFSYVPAHTHSFIELNYMYSGTCIQSLNNSNFEFKQGHLLAIDYDTVQKINYTGKNDLIINILIKDTKAINQILKKITGVENQITRFLNNITLKTSHNNFMLFDLNVSPIAHALMQNLLLNYFDSQKIDHQKTTELLLAALFIQLESTITSAHLDFSTENTSMINVLKYIESNYDKTNLELTSQHFGYNMNYLSNKIKSSTGQTYKEIIEQRRLYAAQDLLCSTNLTLDEISNQIGYKNPSSLNRLFKKYVNTTPIQYKTELMDQIKSKK